MDQNAEVWEDYNDDFMGSPNDPARMDDPDFPEGYYWDCCDEPMDSKGCIVTRHMPEGFGSSKRPRY